MVFRPVGWVSLNVKFLDNFGQIYLMSLHKLDLYNHYSPSLLIKTCIFINSLFISLLFHLSIEKGGSKVWVLRQGDACNSAPKWPNDLKFCMQGAFVGYYWVLVKSRSCDLYREQTCYGLQMWSASIESFGPLGAELQASPGLRNQTHFKLMF